MLDLMDRAFRRRAAPGSDAPWRSGSERGRPLHAARPEFAAALTRHPAGAAAPAEAECRSSSRSGKRRDSPGRDPSVRCRPGLNGCSCRSAAPQHRPSPPPAPSPQAAAPAERPHRPPPAQFRPEREAAISWRESNSLRTVLEWRHGDVRATSRGTPRVRHAAGLHLPHHRHTHVTAVTAKRAASSACAKCFIETPKVGSICAKWTMSLSAAWSGSIGSARPLGYTLAPAPP